ncbi:TonB-dependent receptor domain-containing protein [Rudaea sp.]|uniref:TonB-dependent receptor domain-containing protein n=1 Tax=Rudaea sp. TaxID=2136325 RepID=UPI002ED3F09A
MTKRLPLATAIFCALAAITEAPLTWAQNASPGPRDSSTSEKDSSQLETIVVTGSRISNPNVVSPQPVSIMTAADIKALGATNIGDLLTRMPQLATTFTMGNSGASIGTAGIGAQDLRNLGPSRTLVLVNGRRFVSGNTDVVTVDTNMIPVEMIDRVEILTGGASAVYGADAVTGVMNFILKDHYEGTNLKLQVDDSQRGSFKKYSAAITSGWSFADDRGHSIFNIEHAQNDALFFPSVFGSKSYTSILTPGNKYRRVYMPNGGYFDQLPGGAFTIDSGSYVFDPNGSVRPQRFDGAYSPGNLHCTDCDYLNLNAIEMLTPKYNRTSINFNTTYDLNSSARLYLESSFTWSDTTNIEQPAFGYYTITPDNPYISPALAQLMDGNPITVGRFDNDGGFRNELDQRQTGRVVAGITGTFAGDWQYDASVNYGVTQVNTDYINNRVIPRWSASVDAVTDPASGKIVCRSTLDPGYVNPDLGLSYASFGSLLNGCIPTSIFGDGAVNSAARNWFNVTTIRRDKLTEQVASGTLTNNNLFAMPFNAGSASLVLGAEYRREEMTVTADPLDLTGNTFNNAIPGFGGSFNVKEGFGELGLPLITDKPFFKQLGLEMAMRESDYSTVGHTETWKYGLNWALDDNVRLRFTQSFAERAPNVSELFSGAGVNFFQLTDPCSTSSMSSAPNLAVRQRNCAALGVPPGEYPLPSTIQGISGSNPDLKSERGKTYTYGIVLTPQFVDGLLLSADYWNIKLSDAISVVSAQDIVDNCVDSPGGIANIYCASMKRDPTTHLINFVQQTNLNLVATNTSGIDLAASYSHDIGPGRARFELNATRTLQYTNFPFQDDPTRPQHLIGTDGFPKWKAALDMSYAWDKWLLSWDTRYFSSMLIAVSAYSTLEKYYANPYAYAPTFEGGRVYHDMQVAWGDRKAGLQLYFGMHNVFDRKPPLLIDGTSFGGGLYGNDAWGRSFYAGVNYHF